MKKLILTMALAGLAGSVLAQVSVSREELGSGTPGTKGYENAVKWENDIFHAPQYMPGNPTAATIYPRIVDVKCLRVSSAMKCDGYNWLPELGRGEYLMIRPVAVEAPKTEVVTKTVVVPGPVREVLIEVPAKKKNQ
jgi:hypothetical protein